MFNELNQIVIKFRIGFRDIVSRILQLSSFELLNHRETNSEFVFSFTVKEGGEQYFIRCFHIIKETELFLIWSKQSKSGDKILEYSEFLTCDNMKLATDKVLLTPYLFLRKT